VESLAKEHLMRSVSVSSSGTELSLAELPKAWYPMSEKIRGKKKRKEVA